MKRSSVALCSLFLFVHPFAVQAQSNAVVDRAIMTSGVDAPLTNQTTALQPTKIDLQTLAGIQAQIRDYVAGLQNRGVRPQDAQRAFVDANARPRPTRGHPYVFPQTFIYVPQTTPALATPDRYHHYGHTSTVTAPTSGGTVWASPQPNGIPPATLPCQTNACRAMGF